MCRPHSLLTTAMRRDEAIAWLRLVGRNASARDWGMGETILITVGEPTTTDGITVYPGVVYLYPVAGGGWNLLDCDLPNPEETYEDLESAARGAHEYVARKERSRVKT